MSNGKDRGLQLEKDTGIRHVIRYHALHIPFNHGSASHVNAFSRWYTATPSWAICKISAQDANDCLGFISIGLP